MLSAPARPAALLAVYLCQKALAGVVALMTAQASSACTFAGILLRARASVPVVKLMQPAVLPFCEVCWMAPPVFLLRPKRAAMASGSACDAAMLIEIKLRNLAPTVGDAAGEAGQPLQDCV